MHQIHCVGQSDTDHDPSSSSKVASQEEVEYRFFSLQYAVFACVGIQRHGSTLRKDLVFNLSFSSNQKKLVFWLAFCFPCTGVDWVGPLFSSHMYICLLG